MTSCKKEGLDQPLQALNESKIVTYNPIQTEPKTSFTKDQITDYAWEVYGALSVIQAQEQDDETFYDDIEKNYFAELNEEKKSGYFPWFEDTLFNVMHFKHVRELGEAVVCSKTVGERSYYLVQLTVLGTYHYELTSQDVVEEKSGLTTMVLYMMLATKKDASLGYYSLLSFTKEPHEIGTEIKMFSGIVDAQDEQLYLKNAVIVPEGFKELTDNGQYALNNNRVVTVFAEQKDGTIRQANGCYIHQYLLLTPLEIIENCSKAWVYTSDHELIDVVGVVDTSKELDLALIKIEQDMPYEVSPFELGDMNTMEIADRVYVLGNNKGLMNTLYEGVLTNFWTYKEVEYCQTTIPMESSYSGSALLDPYGRLIGIVSNRIPNQESFIQSIEHIKIFDEYLAYKGKDIPVKVTFTQTEKGKTSSDLIKLMGYYLVYSNENLPSDLKVDAKKSTSIYEAVVDSLKKRNEYLSGAYTLNGNTQDDQEVLYFSPETNPLELEEQRALRSELIKENTGKTELTDFIAYEDVTILAVSEQAEAPYVLVEVKMSYYDKEQSPDVPIKTINSQELLKYDTMSSNYKFVGTVY